MVRDVALIAVISEKFFILSIMSKVNEAVCDVVDLLVIVRFYEKGYILMQDANVLGVIRTFSGDINMDGTVDSEDCSKITAGS